MQLVTNKQAILSHHNWIQHFSQFLLLNTKSIRPSETFCWLISPLRNSTRAHWKITPYFDQASVAFEFSILCVLSVYTERIVIHVCPFDGFCGLWEGWDPVNRFNHTSWVAIVTPTDRPKLVRNHCVIEGFGSVFVLSRCFLNFAVGVGAFVIGLKMATSHFPT